MVQDQLVDYIAAQIKLGASREAIKTALLGAGWQAGDVDDSFKKFEGATAQPVKPAVQTTPSVAAAAKPMSSGAGGASANAFFSKPAGSPGAASGPQVIRMSDLVSSSAGPIASANKSAPVSAGAAKKDMPMESSMASSGSSSKKGLIFGIVAGVIILGLAGAAGYFYMQNNSLSSQITTLSSESSGVTSQIATLNSQVSVLTASSSANATAMAGLVSANQELAKELSFYVLAPGETATSTKVSLTGSLGINANKSYLLTGSFGAKIVISNSKDPKVVAVLAPLVGSSTQISGTYIPGTGSMIVSDVNGTSL